MGGVIVPLWGWLHAWQCCAKLQPQQLLQTFSFLGSLVAVQGLPYRCTASHLCALDMSRAVVPFPSTVPHHPSLLPSHLPACLPAPGTAVCGGPSTRGHARHADGGC